MIPEIYVLVYLFCPKFQVANLIIKFAYIISGIGVVIAGLGYWRFRKAGKLKREKEQTTGK